MFLSIGLGIYTCQNFIHFYHNIVKNLVINGYKCYAKNVSLPQCPRVKVAIYFWVSRSLSWP